MNSRVEESDVLEVKEPPFTKTWHPISHKRLLTHLKAAVEAEALKIENRKYSMSQDGTKMFGTWTILRDKNKLKNMPKSNDKLKHMFKDNKKIMNILNGKDELEYMLGFRNSINKDFAVGLTAGLHVIVCSNMVFSGDFVVCRRHTSGLDDEELSEICQETVEKIIEKFKSLTEWYCKLTEIKLSQSQINYLIVESMKRGAMPPSKFNEFYALFMNKDRNHNHKPTLSDWYGAVTEIMKNDSLFTISKKNKALTSLIKKFQDHVQGQPLYLHKNL